MSKRPCADVVATYCVWVVTMFMRYALRVARSFLLLVLLFGIGLMLPDSALAQSHRIVPVEDPAYEYIHRLQRRGYLLELHPTVLPYTEGEVRAAIQAVDEATLGPVERRFLERLKQALPALQPEEEEVVVGASAEAGMALANTDRHEDLTRPIGDGGRLLPFAEERILVEGGPVVAHVGIRHDRYYNYDPDGISAVKRLVARNENSYVGVNTPFLSVYLGRFSNHWGLYNHRAAIISANPRTYDQIALRLGGQRFAVRGLLAELDNIGPDDEYSGRELAPGSRRRFLAASRFDWRPSRYFALSLKESILYAGENASLSPKFLTPAMVLFFLGDHPPQNAYDSTLLSGMFWAQIGRVTLHGQALLDDFVIYNRDQLTDEERLQPALFALYGSIHVAGSGAMDLGLEADLVTYQTYNNRRPMVRYVYLNRGIANQFNDYISGSLFADLYAETIVPGLIVTPRVTFLAQGEQRLNQPFVRNYPDGSIIDTILTGVTEYTIRTGLQAYFQPDRRFWLRFDGGLNHAWNAGHEEARTRTRFVGLVSFGVRLSLRRTVGINL